MSLLAIIKDQQLLTNDIAVLIQMVYISAVHINSVIQLGWQHQIISLKMSLIVFSIRQP